MKLIIGLGNPGSQYELTRHNVGFIIIDEFAKRNNIEFKLDSKLKGAIGTKTINGEKIMLLKPMTYMNLSGESVIAVMNYYKIEVEDIIVISDDLDSPLGRIRLRDHGSSGGHNGHKNIVNHIHSENYKRIKVGIGRDANIPVVDWVLKKLNEDELATINQAVDKACDALNDYVNGIDFMKIASKYSTKA